MLYSALKPIAIFTVQTGCQSHPQPYDNYITEVNSHVLTGEFLLKFIIVCEKIEFFGCFLRHSIFLYCENGNLIYKQLSP